MTEEERHDDQGELHHASDASVAATHPDLEELPVLVAPSTGAEFNTLRAQIIPKACFKLEDSHFDFDSSFVSLKGLAKEPIFQAGPLKNLLDKHPGAKLSIFGHADPVGRDDYNKTLSGRRAQTIFGLLVRDPKLWEDLYFHHDNQGKDKWGVRAIQIMLNTVGPTKAGAVDGILGDKTRKALKDLESAQNLPAKGFNAKEEIDPGTFKVLAPLYMDAICLDDDGNKFMLTREDFLARGKGKDGKGDIQGCGEFNSILLFSKADKAELDKPENHQDRNSKNTTNRRVMILLFKPGSEINPAKWPCPTVKEGVAGCKARFFSDGEQRRLNTADEREFAKTKDTFACRFYQRFLQTSPCERVIGHFIEVQVLDARDQPIAGVTLTLFKPDGTTEPATTNFKGVAHWIDLEAGQHRIDIKDRGQFPDEILDPIQPEKRERKKESPFDSPGEGTPDEEGSDKAALDCSSIAPRV